MAFTKKNLTVAIIARDAEKTIERCLQSIIQCGEDWPILLVDDSDNDKTAKLAKKVAGPQITIVKPSLHIGTGNARQTAIENIKTPFGLWVDADDQLIAGRLARIYQIFTNEKIDLIFDEAVLYQDSTGAKIGPLNFPSQIVDEESFIWLFERNYFPILTGGFRLNFARKIAYDRRLKACEDYDFLLRAILGNARIKLVLEAGIKYYSRSDSVSRNMKVTRQAGKQIHQKLDCQKVDELIDRSFLSDTEKIWLRVARAQILEDQDTQIKYSQLLFDRHDIIHHHNLTASWLGRFSMASTLAARKKWREALSHLTHLKKSDIIRDDMLNNIGVCYAHQGDYENAMDCFKEALELDPEYADAANNFETLLKDGGNQNAHLKWTYFPKRIIRTNNFYLPNSPTKAQ